MPRMLAAAVLLVVLTLQSPGQAVAGPPEGVSGKMVLDEIEDGLRKYRVEKDERKRVCWLDRLAPIRDARVKAVLEAAMNDRSEAVAWAAFRHLIDKYDPNGYLPPPRRLAPDRPQP